MNAWIIVVAFGVKHDGVVDPLNIAVQECCLRLGVHCVCLAVFVLVIRFLVSMTFLADRAYFHDSSSVFTCNCDDPHSGFFGIGYFLILSLPILRFHWLINAFMHHNVLLLHFWRRE